MPAVTLEAALFTATKDVNRKLLLWTRSIIVIGSIVMHFMANIFLKPIRKLSQELSNFNTDNLEKRIHHVGANDEVKVLSETFNKIMSQIEKAFLREKRFSSSIAHELKTPLTTLKINLDVFGMTENHSETEVKDLTTILQKHNARMIELVDSLLAFSQVEDIVLEDTVSLNELINEIVLEMKKEDIYINNDISIEVDISKYTLIGNKVLLKTAFSNILSNAIKYNVPRGTIKIYIDNKSLIHIKDTGIGIESCHLEKIFEPLYRVNKSRNREIAGAGLGLALTHEIIKKHNGTISAISDGKTYSEFIVDLTASF